LENLQGLPVQPSQAPPPPPSENALRLDLGGAVALAQPQTGTSATSVNAVSAFDAGAVIQPSSAAAAPSATASSSSELEAVEPDGQVRPAIVSGSADVSQFIVGPSGKVYVLFTSRVNLNDTTLPGTCLLAEVDASTGVPTCVDNTLSWITWPQPHSGRNPAIQFDGSGAVYYAGNSSDGHTVLRKYVDGTVTDLISQNVYLNDFLVLNNGGVLLTGTTTSTSARWLRYLSPTSQLQGLAADTSYFLRLFPDGNVYTGLIRPSNGPVSSYWTVSRFLTAANQLDSRPWITDSTWSLDSPPYFAKEALCPEDLRSIRWAFCGSNGAVIQDSFTTGDGKVFAIAGDRGQGGMLMQYYPSVAVGTSAVQKIYTAQSVGKDLVLSGLNSAGQNISNLYDTSTGLEASIFDATNEMEIYHLTYVPETRKMLFDGLRFSDNKYVFGEIDFS
jgi:hypothetical protein